jgi:monofunctional glycosyltransferase
MASSKGKAKTFWQKLWRITKKVFLWLFIAHFIYIILLRWVDPPITMTQLVSWISGHGLKRDYVGRNSVSPNARLAVIASEDQLFPDHEGFDWKSIKKAMAYNKRKPGRIHNIRGASTISQQVAKNVFLWQGGGYFRKGLEAYFTFMIETFWSKKRIMEVYLNVAEMGDGLFGIEMAAQQYFNKPAKNLSRQEAAMIAACLPNPKRYKVRPPSSYVLVRSRIIMQQMNNLETDPDIQRVIGTGPPGKK